MPRPPYQLVDPVLARLPLATGAELEDLPFAGLRRLRMRRRLGGWRMRDVSCWLVGDTLVDTGLAVLADRTAAVARAAGVRRAVLTHHHEDHAGGAAALAAAGVRVLASHATRALVGSVLPIRPYQHLVWGRSPAVAAEPLPEEIELAGRRAVVLPAPGHSADQVVLWVPEEGWLFAGDVFVAARVKAFRRDEDFAATVATLERLAALEVGALLCAHRPRERGGAEQLRRKLEWLLEVEERVVALALRGCGATEIARRLRIPGTAGLAAITLGDVSTRNLVRSILRGPAARAEVRAALAAAPGADASRSS